jgi:hypothetical protein
MGRQNNPNNYYLKDKKRTTRLLRKEYRQKAAFFSDNAIRISSFITCNFGLLLPFFIFGAASSADFTNILFKLSRVFVMSTKESISVVRFSK